MKHRLFLLLGLAIVGCEAQGPAPSATAERPAATATATVASTATAGSKAPGRTFGEPIKLTDETALEAIAADPQKFAGQTVRTTGVVQAVCQSAGCWMEIGDATKRAHIKMAGHAFFVPKDCAGKRAVVEGTVKAGAPEDTCGSKDKCGGEENGALAKTEIVATGVELVD